MFSNPSFWVGVGFVIFVVLAWKPISKALLGALDAALKRREQQALDKIAQAEAAALRDVRNQAVDIAMTAARQIVAGQVQGQRGAALIEAAIKELPAKLH